MTATTTVELPIRKRRVALTAITNLTGGSHSSSSPSGGEQRPAAKPEAELDEDEDGFVDAVDECPYEAGDEFSGCPDSDGDGLLDRQDRCPEEAATTVTVAGIIDPNGVRMQVGSAYRSAVFTVPVNRAFQWAKGQVGITSEPCSAGSVAYVEVRDAEGQPLWPANGQPKTIHRDAVPFKSGSPPRTR